MKKFALVSLFLAAVLALSACGAANETTDTEDNGNAAGIVSGHIEDPDTGTEPSSETGDMNYDAEERDSGAGTSVLSPAESPESQEETSMTMTIGNTPVQVEWEDNESVNALMELVEDEPLTIQMSMYGGFEQVGSLGSSLPRDDVQMTTSAGDIVLYAGDQIVVFYGSNSWAYTRLGKITDKTDAEMADLLSNGDVTITITAE